jgi:release factor glutamine methyltransferase
LGLRSQHLKQARHGARRDARRARRTRRAGWHVSSARVPEAIFAAVPVERRFHVVASNPPYVSEGELAGLPREVREDEPRLALAAGAQGTAVIARLIPQAAERLHRGGWLLIEISPMIEAKVRALLAAHGGFGPAASVKDLAGLPRVVTAQRT